MEKNIFRNGRFQKPMLLLIGAASLFMISFQNCSQKGFQGLTGSSGQSSSDSLANSGTPSTPPPTTPDPMIIPPVPPPPISANKVDVFMASGKMGRTVMSCDDGLTWINNRSDNDNARCWVTGDPNYVECDHSPASSTGLDVGTDGWFYTQYGWGYDGTVRKSRDGKTWQTIKSGGWGGGLAVANNNVFQIWESGWSTSKDQGATWQGVVQNFNFDHAFTKRAGQKLFNRGRKDGELAVSLDSGISWKLAPSFLSGWGDSFAEGNGLIVSTGNSYLPGTGTVTSGNAARSTDNGATWTALAVFQNEGWASNIIFNGTHFINWSNGLVWKSVDGLKWTSVPFVIDKYNSKYWSGSISFNPRTGTYVSIIGNWGSWYATQIAIRSTDGVTWTVLDAQQFLGGHPIFKIVSGEMDASACGK